MTHNQRRNTLRGIVVAVGYTIAGCGAAYAQHPPTAVVGSGEWWPVQRNREWTICHNVKGEFPTDHLVIDAPGMRSIDCDPLDRTNALHLTFHSASDVMWYERHEGHRTIFPGEGPND